jgi:hypothetical protein
MPKIQTLLPLIIIALGISLTTLSGLYTSSFLAILGITIIFWGAILYYIKPTKQIPLSFITINSTPSTNNLNRIFAELKITQKGIYLPPNKLQDPEASLIFIPKKPLQTIPINDEITNSLFTTKKEGILISPPGYGLIKMMEEKLGKSFSKIDLQTLQKQLPTLLIEDLEIIESFELQIEKNLLIFEIDGNIFDDECKQSQKHPQVHDSVGCILSSALACMLAKVIGTAVTISNEEIIGKTTKITYQLLEE